MQTPTNSESPDLARFPDPWPSRQPSWPPAPWLMTGAVLTAWFGLPRDRLTGLMSPCLLPSNDDRRPSRLRFYDVDFLPDADPRHDAQGGHFREAVVGFPAQFETTMGELSAHMWSDSETYMLWGREVFGWPILRAPIHLEGAIWSGALSSSAGGVASLELERQGGALIRVDGVGEQLPAQPSAPWLTPRLLPSPTGERRELLAVRPSAIDPGRRFEVHGTVEFVFSEPHPLADLRPVATHIEMSVGFALRVGDDV